MRICCNREHTENGDSIVWLSYWFFYVWRCESYSKLFKWIAMEWKINFDTNLWCCKNDWPLSRCSHALWKSVLSGILPHLVCCAPSTSDRTRSNDIFVVGYVSWPAVRSHWISLPARMENICPSVSITRWLSLGSSTSWRMRHRERIQEYITKKQPKVQPCTWCWILLACIETLMERIDVCSQSIQGQDVSVTEQNAHLEYLSKYIKDFVKQNLSDRRWFSPVCGYGRMFSQSVCKAQTLVICRESAEYFSKDSLLQSAQYLFNLCVEYHQVVMRTIATIMPRFYTKLIDLQAERSLRKTQAENVLPLVIPFQIAPFRPRENFDVIERQRESLMVS